MSRFGNTSSRIILVLVVIILVVVWGGCGGGQTTTTLAGATTTNASATTSTTAAEGGGELRWAIPTAIDQLDPQASFLLTTGMVVGRTIFDRLVESDENLNIVPRLATDWKVSEDGLTWTFKLRQGVKFHDGTPFNADAVVFTVERAIDPKNALAAGNFAWGGVVKADKIDEFTVALHTGEPVAALLPNIADGGLGSIISPTSVSASGEFKPIGTGAFRFVSWQPDGELVLERNNEYWDGPVSYERLVVVPSTEGSTRVNQLEKGEVDLISLVPIPELERVKAMNGVVMKSEPATSWEYVAMNCARPPFDDKLVRQAFNYAVDKQGIIDSILKGLGRVPDSPIASGYSVHVSVKTYEYSPEKAIALLEQAGWKVGPDGIRTKDGQRLKATLLYGQGNIEEGDAIAQAISSQLANVGADISVQAMEMSTFTQEQRKPLDQSIIEMAMGRFGTGDPDTGMRSTLDTASQPPAGNNFAFYSNPEVDKALEDGARPFDMQERKPFYVKAQELVMDDAPWIFLTERREALAWRDTVKGIRFIPTSAGLIDVRYLTLGQ